MKVTLLGVSLSLLMGSLGWTQYSNPERKTWWSEDEMPLGPGLLEGSGKRITIQTAELRRKRRDGKPTPFIHVKPNTTVKNAEFYVDGGTLILNNARFCEVDVLVTLGNWFVASNSAFENTAFQKGGGWFTAKWSSNWKLTNCLVFGSSFVKMKTTDYGFHLENCSFFHVDFPIAEYRDDPSVESQHARRTVKNCRFVKCRVPVSLLIATENCVFEDCTFFGPYEKFKPVAMLEVSASLVGSAEGFPEKIGPITFVRNPDPVEGAGCSLRHLYRDGRLMIRGFPDPNAPVATSIGSVDVALPNKPGKPKELKPREMKMVRGSKLAENVTFSTDNAQVRGLIVQSLGWRGLAGGASGIHAVVLADDRKKPTGVAYSQEVGPLMQTALAEVIKFMEVKHGGWPAGRRVEISFDDKYTPTEGPSAAVATALLLESLFTGKTYDPAFAVTGDLNADGSVQPVGGIAAKLRGAHKRKSTLATIPYRNETEAVDIAIVDGIQLFAKMQVFVAKTFGEAQAIALENRDPELDAIMKKFAGAFAEMGKKKPADLKKNQEAMDLLREVLEVAPNHLSASILQDYAMGELPAHMSLRGSMSQITTGAYAIWDLIGEDIDELQTMHTQDAKSNLSALNRIKNKIHPKLKPLHSALLDFTIPLKQYLNDELKPDDLDQFWQETKMRSDKVEEAFRRVTSDPEFVEDTLR